METFECMYSKTIYQKSADNTTIALYDGADKSIIVTGEMLPTTAKIKYEIKGEWVNHPKYGLQFKMTDGYSILKPSDRQSIYEYLSSGQIKGIGKITAERIVAAFGERTIEIMEQDISRLKIIKGLSPAKIETIKESFDANWAGRNAIIKMGKYGIRPKLAAKAYARFKSKTEQIIEETPYRLCEVPGITFPVADAMGKDNEEYEESYERFLSCAEYILNVNEQNGLKDYIGDRTTGSVSMNVNDFGLASYKLLRKKSLKKDLILRHTIRGIKEGKLKIATENGVQYIYNAGTYRIEQRLAHHIAKLSYENIISSRDIENLITEAEEKLSIRLGKDQRNAVIKAFRNNLVLIIGPPGTGKTTVIKIISYIHERLTGSSEKIFLAPTGQAAHRIAETIKNDAYTIHSYLNIGTEIIRDVNEQEEEENISSSLVVVDEMSMVDMRLAYQLFSSIDKTCRVVLCGDDEQLQSVGAGAVLRDMIQCNALCVATLNEIYRQDAKNDVYINSHAIRKGIDDLRFSPLFRIIEEEKSDNMEMKMVSTYLEKIKECGIANVMLLSPFKEHNGGVNPLNARIQDALHPNPKVELKTAGKRFLTGEVVMQLKNTDELVNGDIGVVSYIDISDPTARTITVQYTNCKRTYTEEEAGEELNLAYAYTVHKSQGSEADCVILGIHNLHSVMLKRNIVYTAITRAKREVVIIGQESALRKAIQTADKSKRNTGLQGFLRAELTEGEWRQLCV